MGSDRKKLLNRIDFGEELRRPFQKKAEKPLPPHAILFETRDYHGRDEGSWFLHQK
jgi:hypothetical protein